MKASILEALNCSFLTFLRFCRQLISAPTPLKWTRERSRGDQTCGRLEFPVVLIFRQYILTIIFFFL